MNARESLNASKNQVHYEDIKVFTEWEISLHSAIYVFPQSLYSKCMKPYRVRFKVKEQTVSP